MNVQEFDPIVYILILKSELITENCNEKSGKQVSNCFMK